MLATAGKTFDFKLRGNSGKFKMIKCGHQRNTNFDSLSHLLSNFSNLG